MICDRKKSMIVSEITIQSEGLSSFLKNLGKISAKATAAASRNPKAVLTRLH